MLEALLLDLDGTLAETDSVHRITWATVLGPHDIEISEDFYKENISGRLNPDVVKDLLPQVSEEERREISVAKELDFRNRTGALEPLPGLMNFLEKARGKGLKLALVTNAPKENVPAVLTGIGLENAFDSEILAEEVGIGKPAPAPYLAALKDLKLSPGEALAFEDSSSGIASAVEAGIPTVGISSTQDPQKLRDAGAFMVSADFADPECVALLER